MNKRVLILITPTMISASRDGISAGDKLMYQVDGLDIYIRDQCRGRKPKGWRARLDYHAMLICQARGLPVRNLRCVLPARKKGISKRDKRAREKMKNMFE